MTVDIIRGNALALPIADNSVDLIVTSPPYFGLRSYQDGGEHYDGQIGDEPTPAEFVDALIAATREMVRVLKPSGSIWVNLGDKYASYEGNRGSGGTVSGRVDPGRNVAPQGAGLSGGGAVRAKSLMGIPWRYALRCIDDLGLILRAEVIWSKPNGLPESVTDRVRRSHEQWFHLVKQPRYYSAVDEVREPHQFPNQSRTMGDSANGGRHSGETHKRQDGGANPLGKLPSSVWEIDDEPGHLVRSVLSAIHAGSLTIDEGERILTGVAQWATSNGSGQRSTSPATAGSGRADSPARDTASSGSTERRCSHIASPMHSSTERSPGTADNSITHAESGTASDTLSPSLSGKTSDEDRPRSQPSTLPRPTAPTVTSSTTPTPTSSLATEAVCVECACEPATESATDDASAPPSVWTVPTQPLKVPAHLGIDHFAAFPMEWPRRIIRGWSPPGVCVECGEGRRPVAERASVERHNNGSHPIKHYGAGVGPNHGKGATTLGIVPDYRITGYACACPEPTADTTPAVVLDPFGGTGTTALVAHALGRHGISVDMSADYCRLAQWRTSDPGQLAAAMQVEKPPTQIDGQGDLLEGIA